MNRERRAWRVRSLVVATAVSLAAGLSSVGVAAERMPHPEGGWRGHEVERFRGGEPRRGPEIERWRHGDIRHFQEHDLGRWRGGRWLHGDHLGHVGWWWVVDGTWYFYPAPIYPYPDPYIPPSVVAAQSGYWYYCPSVSEYYPYVSDCPDGWTPVLPPPTS